MLETADSRRSWIDLDGDANTYGRVTRPRAPSNAGSPIDHLDPRPMLTTTNSEQIFSLNSPAVLSFHGAHQPNLARSTSEDPSTFGDPSARARSLSRPSSRAKLAPEHNHSQYGDQYSFRPPHHLVSTPPPGLSSADSSTASTRSSSYASPGFGTRDYANVHVASGDDETGVGLGITSDAVVQMLHDGLTSPSGAQNGQSRALIDRTRWSQGSIRSRSSSISNVSPHHESTYKLQEKPSFDLHWNTVDERDEMGLSEDSETDLDDVDYDDDDEDDHDRTSAAVVADEGRGVIVSQLSVQPGTTHLLIGSSNNSNAMPAFLTSNIPQISSTLLALDISANFLGALPPVLAYCVSLEELNIASNPLRVLPVFLADLINLRVLIADATGIATLPDTLADLDQLHTISVRRNKMHALPSWLCLLPALQTLCVDGNPFQGPWKALVEALFVKTPMPPAYPPSTPMFSPSSSHSQSGTETDGTDIEDDFEASPAASHSRFNTASTEDEDYTIMPSKPSTPISPPLPTPASSTFNASSSRPLARTRTAPNRSYYDQSRIKSAGAMPTPTNQLAPEESLPTEDVGYLGDREIRKMKSAGDLRRGKPLAEPQRPPMGHQPASSSNLLTKTSPERPGAKRYATFGAGTALDGSPSRDKSRMPLSSSLWDHLSDDEDEEQLRSTNSPSAISPMDTGDSKATVKGRSGKDSKDKDKSSRWGFLKKMSMGKMRTDTPPPRPPAGPNPRMGHGMSNVVGHRMSRSPQIDLRLSSTGNIDMSADPPSPPISPPRSDAPVSPNPSMSQPLSPGFLAPPSGQPRSAKRRSFLPFDTPIPLSIPEASNFMPGVLAEGDGTEPHRRTPSLVIDIEKQRRREEDRAREAYLRALRSVMAYLKDMHDLTASQQPSYIGSPIDEPPPRSRRPTMVDGRDGREMSTASSGNTFSDSSHLRGFSARTGPSQHTMSVATDGSSGSGSEERVYKDEKGKRAMVVREIVATERTYVKGMQELVDIYIKPGCAPVNLISGVGSTKETVVPAPDRKAVFSGLDSLFSFHSGSFLPALEAAAAPLMKPSADKDFDSDGKLSLEVARSVGNIFVKHAAFMKMYSTYINNFDNSVQRVKYWTSDRDRDRHPQAPTASPSPTLSPSPSTSQLSTFSMAIAGVSSPNLADQASSTAGLPNLTSGQRKRIRQYLKRCRLNPRHSQLNLEGYLLLPIQRIPRYRLLLEELVRSTPPSYEMVEDPLDRALTEISSLATNMNEGKRESEGRRKLVLWQARIRGKFPSPLVQPHRRFIMDGTLLLTRVVRKAVVNVEAINAQGNMSSVQVDCLAPELTPRPLVGILCNDLLVLCRDPTDGQDPSSSVDLWAVLRMQTLAQPASIVHGNALRLVDNKAILYFEAPSSSDALNWYRAINLHIPANSSKT
ncbi:hypothetical protein CYLTODRAFT_381929 [Cylindrobasidium torrendii FP15055 ss-10]|uniref:DH domain-containing protein n=1 Tax=Cylindrobasidium torrendii FP15055 ss-10 TaxID=1314674 RepID=A0A0D7AZH9_9AGAR|nr:hypothetical protein CYLTODRAFT_381929 [Cylindrobasidium torrendii FP15055 ss-10]